MIGEIDSEVKEGRKRRDDKRRKNREGIRGRCEYGWGGEVRTIDIKMGRREKKEKEWAIKREEFYDLREEKGRESRGEKRENRGRDEEE